MSKLTKSQRREKNFNKDVKKLIRSLGVSKKEEREITKRFSDLDLSIITFESFKKEFLVAIEYIRSII